MALALAKPKPPLKRMLIMPTKNKGSKKMKLIEFILLAVGAVIGAYLRYRLVESPVTVDLRRN
jgi:hypothetical protein